MPDGLKILYAVSGEGRGHATRSLAIAEGIASEADIHFIAGGRGYELLTQSSYPATEIPYVGIVLTRRGVSSVRTLLRGLGQYIQRPAMYKKIRSQIEAIDPDIILCDFEYSAPRIAAKLGIPIIQISNHVIFQVGKYPVPPHQWINYLKVRWVAHIFLRDVSNSLIPSFFTVPIKQRYSAKNIRFLPLPLRPAILAAQPTTSNDSPVVVYFTSSVYNWAGSLLGRFPQTRFIIYGLSPPENPPHNVEYKRISLKGYAEDLARARALITNAGIGSVGEAIYLRKPVLSLCPKGHFEQYLNGYYLEQMKCGVMVRKPRAFGDALSQFLSNLSRFNGFPTTVPGEQDADSIASTVMDTIRRLLAETSSAESR